MKQLTAFLVLFLLPFSACQRLENNVQLLTVDIDPKSQPKGDLMLSDLVEQVEYIPLEINDNCIVGDITSFDVSENYIVVYVMQTREIFLFMRTGRFVAKIGRRGQSDAEYVFPGSVFIDELKQCVYVKDARKMLMYDFSGKHLNSFPLDYERIFSINLFHDNQFISGKISNQSNEDYYVFGIWDSNMNFVKQGVKGVPLNIRSERGTSYVSFGPELSYYIYQDYPHLKESVLNDTVYLLNKTMSLFPNILSIAEDIQ